MVQAPNNLDATLLVLQVFSKTLPHGWPVHCPPLCCPSDFSGQCNLHSTPQTWRWNLGLNNRCRRGVAVSKPVTTRSMCLLEAAIGWKTHCPGLNNSHFHFHHLIVSVLDLKRVYLSYILPNVPCMSRHTSILAFGPFSLVSYKDLGRAVRSLLPLHQCHHPVDYYNRSFDSDPTFIPHRPA
jgi:hypothetical protein